MLCSRVSLWWMICIILRAAFAWFLSFYCKHLLNYSKHLTLKKNKSLVFLIEEEEEVSDPSLINKHQMKCGRFRRAEMRDCYVTFESSEETDCSPLTCRPQSQWLTAESCHLSTQTTANIHPSSFYTCSPCAGSQRAGACPSTHCVRDRFHKTHSHLEPFKVTLSHNHFTLLLSYISEGKIVLFPSLHLFNWYIYFRFYIQNVWSTYYDYTCSGCSCAKLCWDLCEVIVYL